MIVWLLDNAHWIMSHCFVLVVGLLLGRLECEECEECLNEKERENV